MEAPAGQGLFARQDRRGRGEVEGVLREVIHAFPSELNMPEITRKRTGQLVQGIFKILSDHPDGLPAKVVLDRLTSIVPPTPFEESTYPARPDVRRYEKIARFSTIASVKAGWLIKDRGQWQLTEAGKQAFIKFQDPEALMREGGRLYREWAQENPNQSLDSVKTEKIEVDGDSPGAATTLEESEEAAWSEIEQHLAQMNPFDFQDLVAGLLQGMGYHIIHVAPPGPDHGIDILAHTDPLGIQGPRIKVQVKRRADRTDSETVRSFTGLIEENDSGLFFSTGGFTKSAELEVRQKNKRVMLIDAKRLLDLWIRYYDKIPEEARRLLPLKPVYFLIPNEIG
jgi:restriction system protein